MAGKGESIYSQALYGESLSALLEHMLCVRQCPLPCSCIISFRPPNNPEVDFTSAPILQRNKVRHRENK